MKMYYVVVFSLFLLYLCVQAADPTSSCCSCGLYGVGKNDEGQLGDGTTAYRASPTTTAPVNITSSLTQIVAQYHTSMAVDASGEVYTWGSGALGLLGDADTLLADKYSPVKIFRSPLLAGKVVTSIATNNGFSLALTSGGLLYGWGLNSYSGQLGSGVTCGFGFPYAISSYGPLASKNITHVVAANSAAMALTDNGELYFWGYLDNTLTPAAVVSPSTFDTTAFGGSTIISLASGEFHFVALTENGKIFSWGNNDDSQLGSTNAATMTPVPLLTANTLAGKPITSFAVGFTHSVLTTSDGLLFSWGSGSSGQLGLPYDLTSSFCSPVQIIVANKKFVSVTTGNIHTLALTDQGVVYAWGDNTNGQLGDASTTSRYYPATVNPLQLHEKIVAISAGEIFSVALSASGKLYSWGVNNYGQMGSDVVGPFLYPTLVTSLGAYNVSAVDCGGSHVLALLTNGRVLAWGSNDYGQLGLSNYSPTSHPTLIAGLPHNVKQVSAGRVSSFALTQNGLLYQWGDSVANPTLFLTNITHVYAGYEYCLAVTTDGTVVGWGKNDAGQLGDTTTVDKTSPVEVAGILSFKNVVAIAGGLSTSYALSDEGVLYGWGQNSGDGTCNDDLSPVIVNTQYAMPGTNITAVFASSYRSFLLTEEGNLFGWGNNDNSALGDGSVFQKALPVPIGSLLNLHVTQVAAGQTHTLAITGDGVLYVWGTNSKGELGLGHTDPENFPIVNTLLVDEIVYIAAGLSQSLVLASDGSLYAFGDANTGDGTASGHSIPTRINDNGDLQGQAIVTMYCEAYHSLVITAEGKVIEWGQTTRGTLLSPSFVNDRGALSYNDTVVQVASLFAITVALTSEGKAFAWGAYTGDYTLGENPTDVKPFPVAVSDVNFGGAKVIQAAVGGVFAIVLTDNNKLYGWGYNSVGQLGTGVAGNVYYPVPVVMNGVLNGKTIKTVKCGMNQVVVLTTDGKVYSWGYNSEGQLGIGNNNNMLTPTNTLVNNIGTVTEIATGELHTLALLENGDLYAWGSNANYQFGDNTNTNSYTPVLASLITGYNIKYISAIGGSSALVTDNGEFYFWGLFNGYLYIGATLVPNYTVGLFGHGAEYFLLDVIGSSTCATTTITTSNYLTTAPAATGVTVAGTTQTSTATQTSTSTAQADSTTSSSSSSSTSSSSITSTGSTTSANSLINPPPSPINPVVIAVPIGVGVLAIVVLVAVLVTRSKRAKVKKEVEMRRVKSQNNSNNNNNSSNNSNSSKYNQSNNNNSNNNNNNNNNYNNNNNLSVFPETRFPPLPDAILPPPPPSPPPAPAPEKNEKMDYILNVKLLGRLAAGNFGTVFKAEYRNAECAAKLIIDQNMDTVLAEAKILSSLRHPNIVQFLGIYKGGETEDYLVTEFVSGGDLLRVLQQHGSQISLKHKMHIACGIAAGMSYLEDRRIAHCDLACRNVLMDKKGDVYHSKITDFGMSVVRKRGDTSINKDGKVPVRWTAPEAIKNQAFNSESDVWSFGMTLLEILTNGKPPYSEIENIEAVVKHITAGKHPKLPNDTLPQLKNLLTMCWNIDPKKRPRFTNIFAELNSICESLPGVLQSNNNTVSSTQNANIYSGGSSSSSNNTPATQYMNSSLMSNNNNTPSTTYQNSNIMSNNNYSNTAATTYQNSNIMSNNNNTSATTYQKSNIMRNNNRP